MKKILLPVITGIVLGAIGFLIGQGIGYNNGQRSIEMKYKFRSVEEIKAELKEREQEKIISYLNSKAEIKTIDEGSLFKINYVQYFVGNLTNSATLATAKDVKLSVNFYSKTGSEIGTQLITIYELIEPRSTIKFKEKIEIPDKAENFEFQIIDSKTE